jgi:hypothetical protein
MTKKVLKSICLVLILALFAGVVQAQEGNPTPRPTPTNVPDGDGGEPPADTGSGETKGSIRGTVYNDVNADGACADEPVLAGVPIKFVSQRGDTSVYLQSGANGTYGLVAAGLGTWTVTAEPGAGMIVTSQNPLQVFIGEDNTLALNVNFCVAAGAPAPAVTPLPGVVYAPSYGPGPKTVILPTAGANIAPTLIATGVTGLGLILFGFSIEMRRRRNDKPASRRNVRPGDRQ